VLDEEYLGPPKQHRLDVEEVTCPHRQCVASMQLGRTSGRSAWGTGRVDCGEGTLRDLMRACLTPIVPSSPYVRVYPPQTVFPGRLNDDLLTRRHNFDRQVRVVAPGVTEHLEYSEERQVRNRERHGEVST
jgi:hypothetical protein